MKSRYFFSVMIIFLFECQIGYSQFTYRGFDYVKHSLLQITQGSTEKTFYHAWSKDEIVSILGDPKSVQNNVIYDEGDLMPFDKYDYGDLWLWFDEDRLAGYDVFGQSRILVDGHFSIQIGDNPSKLARMFPNVWKLPPNKAPIREIIEAGNRYKYGDDIKEFGHLTWLAVGDEGMDISDGNIRIVWNRNNKIVQLQHVAVK